MVVRGPSIKKHKIDAITADEVFVHNPLVPCMEEVMVVHGSPFELPAIEDSESISPPAKTVPNTFNPISP